MHIVSDSGKIIGWGELLVYSKFKRLMELHEEEMGRKVEDYID